MSTNVAVQWVVSLLAASVTRLALCIVNLHQCTCTGQQHMLSAKSKCGTVVNTAAAWFVDLSKVVLMLQNDDKVICQQCHAAFYCSAYCQKKDAQSHKTACKRARLKSKLALKGAGK